MIQPAVLNSFAKKKVLVTGGTGLIGRQVVNMLCDANAQVTILTLDSINIDKRAMHIIGDLTSFDYCLKSIKDMDFVFHLAGVKGSADVSNTKLASHFIPTLMLNTNVLEACRRNKVKKVVYTSSIGAYANADVFKESDYKLDSLPMDFAGWSKRMAELQIHAYHVQYGLDNFSIVRPCNVYGPGDNFDPNNAMVIPSLMYKIKRGDDPVRIWGDGSAIRDFAYSRDVAEGVILALYYGTKSSFVNLGSGRGYSVKELVEALHSFLDFNYEFDTTKPSGYPKRIMDISLARSMIHYNPTTSLLEGLKQTWEWFIANQDEYLHKKNYFIEG
jgi:GDP-L-fucose synthase